ncbi:glycosyltransferase family 4 protein [Microbacteriaceae bacterium 4G12]
MRIVFDCRYTRVGRHDGISRYTASLVEALGRRHEVTMLISDHRQLEMLPSLPWERVSAPTSIREPFVARQVNRIRPDVVFSPMQTMGTFGRAYKVVLTIHDVIYYSHRTPPLNLPAPIRLLWRLYHLTWWPQRFLLNRADAVVTVSETTAQIIRARRLTRRPVAIVRNAADLGVNRTAPAEERERSLVYMGSYMPYKNVETLARALHGLAGYTLHLISRESPEDRARLTALAPEGALVFHGGASDEEYREVLSRATALVSASRDEGFGIPLVEAMSVGTPVVVSDIPIFREIGGDAALYFDPSSPEDVASAVHMLEDPAELQRRSAAAYDRHSEFSWESSADALLDLLLRVGEGRP